MKLPAGIEKGVEIFRSSCGEIKVMVSGNKIDYMDLPSILREPFQAELISDKKAIKCLHDMNLYEADEMELKFVSCRYGGYDNKSDLEGHETCPDAPNCEHIKDCPGFNIICKIPKGKNGILSRQEYLITLMISKGRLDKEIANELGCEVSTVRTHLARIREKLCVNNRIEIHFWAINNGII